MKYYVEVGHHEVGLEILHTQEGIIVRPIEFVEGDVNTPVDFAAVHADIDTGEGLYSLIAGGKSYQLYVEPAEHGFRMAIGRQRFTLSVLTEREWRLRKSAPRQATQSGQVTISAPMPGLVKSVLVAKGDAVSRGQRLLVLEAMKMENDINAPGDGRITQVHVEAGTVVEGGKPLLVIES
jgi:biotin carboxyl carrier protein